MLFVARAFNFLFQPLRLAVQRTHGVSGGGHAVNQPFSFLRGVFEPAYNERDRDPFPPQLPLAPAVWLGILLAADAGEFILQLLRLVVMFRHLFNLIDGGLSTGGKNIVSNVLFVKDHYLFYGTRA